MDAGRIMIVVLASLLLAAFGAVAGVLASNFWGLRLLPNTQPVASDALGPSSSQPTDRQWVVRKETDSMTDLVEVTAYIESDDNQVSIALFCDPETHKPTLLAAYGQPIKTDRAPALWIRFDSQEPIIDGQRIGPSNLAIVAGDRVYDAVIRGISTGHLMRWRISGDDRSFDTSFSLAGARDAVATVADGCKGP